MRTPLLNASQSRWEARRYAAAAPRQHWFKRGVQRVPMEGIRTKQPAQMWGESRRRCGPSPGADVGRVPAQMWGESRRRCARAHLQVAVFEGYGEQPRVFGVCDDVPWEPIHPRVRMRVCVRMRACACRSASCGAPFVVLEEDLHRRADTVAKRA
jgi:hypothetical protein